MRELDAEIAESIAAQLMFVIDEFKPGQKGIPIGDLSLAIVDIDYNEGEDTIGLLMNDGRTWELRPYEVRPTLPTARVNRRV